MLKKPWLPALALAAGQLLLAALESAAATAESSAGRGSRGKLRSASRTAAATTVARSYVAGPSLLDRVDLKQRLSVATYEESLRRLQGELAHIRTR